MDETNPAWTGPNPKAEPYARVKARRDRLEAKVKAAVRAQCVERDGYCLLYALHGYGACAGPSEWAHIGTHRRCFTRGLPPTERHTTVGSAMLCEKHHAAYDRHEFDIEPLDAVQGMNGSFRVVGRASPKLCAGCHTGKGYHAK